MKQKQTKYFVIVSGSVALILFVIYALTSIGLFFLNAGISSTILIIFLVSILSSILLSAGILVFSPTFQEAISIIRRMLRFESLSNPLLLRLSSEAPGTYHHSINVSNLAQKAAKAIGADSLLVRVAAYYHDIGKLENPTSYIENQSGSEIPRTEDAEAIRQSTKNIIAHVARGVEIAQKNHLPEEIIDLIKEHHGSTKVLYFYELAKEKGLKIKKTEFKYPGPTPHTKESVILMLADSVEAAARAIPSLTKDRIEEIIKSAIEDKISEKQLANCPISPLEINKIKQSLTDSLLAIYHQRLVYKNETAE